MNHISRGVSPLRIVALGIVAVLSVGYVYTQQVGRPADDVQQRVLDGLRSSDKEARHSAVAEALKLSPAQTTTAVRSALVGLMDNQTEVVTDLRARGVPVDTVEDPEFVADVQRVVANLKDPSSIPALARTLGSTFVAVRPLAQFGEPAAMPVLEIVESPDSHYSAVAEGLLVLRFMVEKRAERPLAPTTLDRIRRVAHQRITGSQYFTVLWRAIDLASTLQDDALNAIIRDLATNPQETVVRGIVNPSLVKQTQERAEVLLTGKPPLPRADF